MPTDDLTLIETLEKLAEKSSWFRGVGASYARGDFTDDGWNCTVADYFAAAVNSLPRLLALARAGMEDTARMNHLVSRTPITRSAIDAARKEKPDAE